MTPCLDSDQTAGATENAACKARQSRGPGAGDLLGAWVSRMTPLAALVLMSSAAAHATSYTVNTTADSIGAHNCSLRDAINAANGSPTSDRLAGPRNGHRYDQFQRDRHYHAEQFPSRPSPTQRAAA